MYTKLSLLLVTLAQSVVGKPDFCIYENKGADQLHDNRPADQRLFFRYIDSTSTIPLLPKSQISWFRPSAQPGLYRTWWEISKTGLLMTGLKYENE